MLRFADGTGQFPPGALTGVLAAAVFAIGSPTSRDPGLVGLRLRGGGYVLLHLGAVVEKRDEAEEAKRFSQRGTAEFPGIVEPESFWKFRHQNRLRRAAGLTGDRVGSDATAGWTKIKA